jgi:hypothetical protein
MAFSDMFRRKKRPQAERKASRTRPFKKDEAPEELPSGMRVKDTETRAVGKRRPNESQELKAKASMDSKKETGPAPMMRREAVTAKGMPAEGQPKSIAEARKAGKDTFIGKDGRKKAAVTKEELEASGYKSLREYLNAQRKSKPKDMKKGGKTSSYKKGGTVRGAGKATKGVRAAKMVSMKGS